MERVNSTNSGLQASVASLSSSLSLLRSASINLDDGVKDFDRLKTVLDINRVFEIVAEAEIEGSKTEIAREIEPQIADLLSRAKIELERMERKDRSLATKADLQQVRLNQQTGDKSSDPVDDSGPPSKDQLEELQQLKDRKERLLYSLSRLNLQSRKIRMSMAFQN